MKRKATKRFLAFALSFFMVLGSYPTDVGAWEMLGIAPSKAKADGYWTRHNVSSLEDIQDCLWVDPQY